MIFPGKTFWIIQKESLLQIAAYQEQKEICFASSEWKPQSVSLINSCTKDWINL